MDGITYYDPHAQAKIMKKCFQSVFTKESNFHGALLKELNITMDMTEVDMSETWKIMEIFYRKAMALNILSWILHKCSEQFVKEIFIYASNITRRGQKVPSDWKQTNIFIFK